MESFVTSIELLNSTMEHLLSQGPTMDPTALARSTAALVEFVYQH
jgi:hypothetical protein